ncbi:MAG TPA: histidine kinase dimerization/phospho-acceptor domain-containing protein, partial [candidate division Zixibacteria bacterium]|nr:histidine kinase dimerization/phospho-acceptor domain-containing protein [candidate division Zixibacteria bacterium]
MKSRSPVVWTVVGFAVVLLVVINLGYRAIIDDLRASIDTEIGAQLSGLAEFFAGQLDPAMVSGGLADGDAFSPEDYIDLWEATDAFATGNRLVSVTILDTLWQDPFATETDSLTSTVYALLDQGGALALKAGLPWVSETYQWEGGYYRSAAAPIIDTATQITIGMVRVEADARYFDLFDRLEDLALVIHLLSGVLAIGMAALMFWYAGRARRWEAELLHTEKLVGLGRLAATIAHEIKNPLGIIRATAQRLQKLEETHAGTPEKRAELIAYIPDETERLNRILSRYLAVADPSTRQPRPVAVDRELQSWVDQLARTEEYSDCRCHVTIAPSKLILADPEAPRQVVINLMSNAVDVTPPGGIIE